MDLFYHETFMQSEQMPMELRLHRGQINYMILEHWHRSIEIDYLLDCEADFYMNGKKKAVSAGSITLINSGDIHALEPREVPEDPGDEIHGISLFISYEFLKKICPEIDQITFELEGAEERLHELKGIFDDLIRLELSPAEEYGYLKKNALLHQLMYLLLTYFKGPKNSSAVKSQKYIDRLRVVLDYVEENYQEPLTLQGVADHFNVSMEYLARILKKYTGNTFKMHLNQVRVSKAFRDLLETDYSILEIAMRSGFPDTRSFINVFRDTYGMTPSQYRKKNPRRETVKETVSAEYPPHIRVVEPQRDNN